MVNCTRLIALPQIVMSASAALSRDSSLIAAEKPIRASAPRPNKSVRSQPKPSGPWFARQSGPSPKNLLPWKAPPA